MKGLTAEPVVLRIALVYLFGPTNYFDLAMMWLVHLAAEQVVLLAEDVEMRLVECLVSKLLLEY